MRSAIGILGTLDIDRESSTLFFRDPERLYRDLLADAAARALRRA